MAERGQVKEADFRIIYRSQKFPTSSFAYAHDLDPKLVDKMLSCFYDYRFPPEMQKAFDGADRFFPINYKTTWEVVRAVAKGSGGGFDKATYDKETQARGRRGGGQGEEEVTRSAVNGARYGRPRCSFALDARRSSTSRSRTSPASRCCTDINLEIAARGITAIIGAVGHRQDAR